VEINQSSNPTDSTVYVLFNVVKRDTLLLELWVQVKGQVVNSNEKEFNPCSKVLLKKLVIAHTVKKFAVLMESKGSLADVYVVITLAMVMLLRDFGPYGIIFFSVCCYNCCHGNAVKRCWTVWNSIYDHVCLLFGTIFMTMYVCCFRFSCHS
jgi:hypothetical protein